MTFPRALDKDIRKPPLKDSERKRHLNATKTERALSAFVPNTFLKNKPATVTPEFSISCDVAALYVRCVRMSDQSPRKTKKKNDDHVREIRYVCKNI